MTKHIYIIAGEASGDFLGAQLMIALKKQNPDIQFSGVGGTRMVEQGLDSLFPMNELSVMGVFEIAPKLKRLLGRISQTADDVIAQKPDIVITIDAPDFSFRVHKRVRKALGDDAPILTHYVAPTVWAWRAGRAKKIAKFLDHLICLFDFEPSYFEKEGLNAIAVGHPMMESGLLEAKPLVEYKDKQTLGVFFGSRQSEVKRLAPILTDAMARIIRAAPETHFIIPTLSYLEEPLTAHLAELKKSGASFDIITDSAQKWSVFKSCKAAIGVSGTVGLELAACNVPHLIAYNMNPLTAIIVRALIKTRFAHLANIIMDKAIVTEFIQENCKAEPIAREAIKLLNDDQVRLAQINAFEEVRARIMGNNKKTPSDMAADFILSAIK